MKSNQTYHLEVLQIPSSARSVLVQDTALTGELQYSLVAASSMLHLLHSFLNRDVFCTLSMLYWYLE